MNDVSFIADIGRALDAANPKSSLFDVIMYYRDDDRFGDFMQAVGEFDEPTTAPFGSGFGQRHVGTKQGIRQRLLKKHCQDVETDDVGHTERQMKGAVARCQRIMILTARNIEQVAGPQRYLGGNGAAMFMVMH